MNFEFERVSVSDVCELIVDCVNKTAPKVEHKTQFKMIRTPNIRNGVINLDGCNYVSEETYEKWTRRATVKKDDILLTREAPMGEVGIIDFEDTVFLGQRIMQYRANKSKLCPKFLLYSFLSSDLKKQFYQHEGSGSVVSHIRVPDCLKFEINLPPLKIQRKISSFLWGVDQKIKNNNKMNQTLEQMAQALFKSWFVDFEPVKAKIAALEAGGTQEEATLAAMTAISGKDADALVIFEHEQPEQYAELKATAELFPSAMQESELGVIPDGWILEALGAILEPKKGKNITKKTVEEGNIPVVAGGLVPAYYHSKYNVNGPVITISASGANAGFVNLYHCNIWASDCSYINKNQTQFVYCFYTLLKIKQKEITHMQQGAAQPHVYPKDIMRLNIVIPITTLWQKLEGTLTSIYEQIGANTTQNRCLELLRDTLLPKLLSGEITLPEAEQAASEVENV